MTKKRINIIIIATVTLVLVWLVIYFTFTGLVTIKTDKNNDIFTQSNANGKITKKKVGKGNSQLRLWPGNYGIIVQNGSAETQITTVVKSLATSQYEIKLQNPNKDSLVIRSNVSSLQANKDSLNYIDNIFQKVQKYNLTSKNITDFIPDSIDKYYQVKWLAPNQGIATLVGGYIYLVNQQGLTPYTPPSNENPQAIIGNTDFDYFISANGKNISFIIDHKIYSYDLNSGKQSLMQDVYSDKDSYITFADLSNAGVLAFSSLHEEQYSDRPDMNTGGKNETVLLDINQNKSEKIENLLPNLLQWSPSGDQLLISTSANLTVYNVKSKERKVLLTFPIKSLTTLRWLNDNEFIYYNDGGLWRYQIDRAIASKVSDYPNSSFASESTISTDGLYYYYVIPTSNSLGIVGEVRRIPIK